MEPESGTRSRDHRARNRKNQNLEILEQELEISNQIPKPQLEPGISESNPRIAIRAQSVEIEAQSLRTRVQNLGIIRNRNQSPESRNQIPESDIRIPIRTHLGIEAQNLGSRVLNQILESQLELNLEIKVQNFGIEAWNLGKSGI